MAFEVGADDRFGDLLRSATAQIAETIEHRTYPYADIVRDARNAGLVVPDVSCMLAYEQLAPTTFPGATAEHRILASGTAVADLTFFVQERPDRVQLGLEYRGAVLARSDAERLLDVFATMLLEGSAAPGRPVADLTAVFVGPDAVGAVLEPPRRSVLRQIVEQAAVSPDAPAVVDSSGRTLGYDELVCAATLLADRITEFAPTPVERVGVAVRRSTDLVVAMLGSQLAGAAYVPLDPTAPAGRLAAVASAARLDVLVVDGAGPSIDTDVPLIDIVRIDTAATGAERDELRARRCTASRHGRPRRRCVRDLHLGLDGGAARRRGEPSQPRCQQRRPVGPLRTTPGAVPRHVQHRLRQLDGRSRLAAHHGRHRRAPR